MKQQQVTQEKNLKIKSLLSYAKPKRAVMGLFAVVFVLVFALDSGKGVAGTWTQYANAFVPYCEKNACGHIGTDCNGSKGCQTVVKLDKSIYWCIPMGISQACGPLNGYYNALAQSNFFFGAPWSNISTSSYLRAQFCFSARSQVANNNNGNYMHWDVAMNDGTPGGSGDIFIPSTTTYKGYCGSWFNVRGGSHNGLLTVKNNAGSSELYIYSATLNW